MEETKKQASNIDEQGNVLYLDQDGGHKGEHFYQNSGFVHFFGFLYIL